MSGYIGKVHITGEDPVLVGSTLYGICNSQADSAAKTVISTDNNSGKFINNHYNQLLQGTTIHVKFVNGNTATNNLTLQVGTLTTTQNIVGNCVCAAGAIISFTLDENEYWVVNDNVDNDTKYTFATGSTNGTINVTPTGGTAQSVSVYGLQDSAYKGVITNIANNSSSTDLPTAAAVASYVQDMTGGLAGLSGAMHFRGIVTDTTVTITDGGTELPKIEGYDLDNGNPKANFTPTAGDVVLFGQQEYVWSGSAWELLGDESSYALKSSTDTITEVGHFTANTLPALDVTPITASSVTVANGTAPSLSRVPISVPNVTTAGTPMTASVTGGILTLTPGTSTTLGTNITFDAVGTFNAGTTPQTVTATNVSFDAVGEFRAGTQASLTTNDTVVVVPTAQAQNP